MVEFQLFRIKVYPPSQTNLLEPERTRPELLVEVIRSMPLLELRVGSEWSIGNLRQIDDYGLYFRVGRTAKSKTSVKEGDNFVDQDFESAPYTHVLLDTTLEVLAVAKKSQLSPNVAGIANQLSKLLNRCERAKDLSTEFQIDTIQDPEKFIEYIESAYEIFKFTMTLSRPNPFDVDEDFQKPMQKLLEETKAQKGKAEVQGRNLNSDRLIELT